MAARSMPPAKFRIDVGPEIVKRAKAPGSHQAAESRFTNSERKKMITVYGLRN